MVINMSREYLEKMGMKPALLDKLSDKKINMLVEYAMDIESHPEKLKVLIQLASMEFRGKEGAIQLAKDGLATVPQLKDLTIEQIEEVKANYEYYEDVTLVKKMVHDCIVNNQQAKISDKTCNRYVDNIEVEGLDNVKIKEIHGD
jgi:hypothetical protein